MTRSSDAWGLRGWVVAAYVVAAVGIADSILLMFNRSPVVWVLKTAAPLIGIWAAKRGRLDLLGLCWAAIGVGSYILEPEPRVVAVFLAWVIAPLGIVPLVAHFRQRDA